ncbi:MAG TPA: F0F1 ATP synthase subunit delta [Pseudonocardiaceae bacterium]|nr:F0F1 ATP synthase subunit delta [Pseudonocardiaceae bacterium]
MQSASRESLAAARERLDEVVAGADSDQLRTLADELFAVLGVLQQERVLRRHLTDPGTPEDARERLTRGVFGGKVGDAAVTTVAGLATARWSSPSDLLEALEALARRVTFVLAERDGVLEDVEDELFRFSRILVSEPRLRSLLADQGTPAEGRVRLLDTVLADRVTPVTAQLLEQTVREPRGRSLELVVSKLAEDAAAMRSRSVAQVVAAAPLTDEQESRLAQTLATIFGRAVSVQVELDPDMLGGLVIRVGDEVIDGSVAARLAKARQELPG